MYISILFLPLLLLFIIFIFSRYIGHQGIYKIINLIMLELLIISINLNWEILLDNNVINFNLFSNYEIIRLNWSLYFDNITSIMIFMIISISWIVIIYSYDYMINEAHINRFYFYIILFILNMLILITTNNIIILFIGWEGVGLSSYLLITFWFTRLETNWGGLLALFMNRIGDIFYLIAILFSYLYFYSMDLIIINNYQINAELFIFFFFIAAMAKSAQLYLHLWLPFSMEGPTPISALIHAATMVTAGVYILIRISLLISYSYYIIFFIIFISSLTCFIGASLAITSLDMKELIAYSTMSQLGYMITCIALKLTHLSFFHLIFHAYFKALLFLTIGSIIHTILDIQDIRFTGSLINYLPISYIFLLIGLTSLIGLPFTTGFYSKESLIMMAYNNNFHSILDLFLNKYVFIITLLTALITIIYSYKLIYNLFLNTTKLSLFLFKHLHFYSLNLILSLSILSFITLFIGYILFEWNILLNLNIPFLNHNLLFIIKLIPLLFYILSYYILNRIYLKNQNLVILNIAFGFKAFYLFISSFIIHISYRILYKLLDIGIIDLLIPITSINLYNLSSKISNYLQIKYILSIFIISLYILLYI